MDQSIRWSFTVRMIRTVCIFVAVCISACAAPEQRPNIILLMGDDHGWDETGYNGHQYVQTPVLDEMAASGLRLDRFYSAHPTCSPTRGSVITGRHPNRYGTFSPNYSIRPEEISIAQILGKAGYATGHFGKWHLGPVKAESPTNPGALGFDEWLSHDNFFEMNPTLSRNGGPPEQFPGESSEIVIDETIRFITTARESGQPFFAVVWFGSPHEPYSGLEQDLALYEDLPDEYKHQTVKLTSNETGKPTVRPLDEVLQERYAEITAMDRSIGKLRQWLDAEKLRENTVLWYCGDNGTPASGIITVPMRGLKGTVYGGGIRVPGIIEWPARISSPQISGVNTVTSDMLPTLCDLVELPVPERPMDGISLNSLLDGDMTERPSPIYFWQYDTKQNSTRQPYIDPELQKGTTPLAKIMNGEFTRTFTNFHHPEITALDYNGSRVILGNRYKLVIAGEKGNDSERELFDVRTDPAEKHNLIEMKPDVAGKMERQLREWQGSVLNSLTGADYR
jgi:arylsulfatase A-like enzyme